MSRKKSLSRHRLKVILKMLPVNVILPKPELTKMIKMRTAKIIMKIMQIKMILQQPTKANTQYIRMITNI